MKVLLVDNDPIVLTLLTRRLHREADITVCGTATTAVAAVGQGALLAPDVVVLDWHLPDSDGEPLTAALGVTCPQSRIIIYTSDADPRIAQAAVRVGAERVIVKGGDLAVLVETIRGARGSGSHPSCLPPQAL